MVADFAGKTYQKQIRRLLRHYNCWLSRYIAYDIIFSTLLSRSTMFFCSSSNHHNLLSFSSEAHPDVIGNDGLAPLEGYQNDLAYLKSKVSFLNQNPHFLLKNFIYYLLENAIFGNCLNQ